MADLRDYQKKAILSWGGLVQRNPSASGLIVLPTGTGKTFTGLLACTQLARRVLWIAHREELISQPYEAARKILPQATIVAREQRGRKAPPTASLVIASLQTLAGKGRLDEILARGTYDMIVIDEAHHATAATYTGIVSACREREACSLLGLTATPERADKSRLGDVFEDGIVYQYRLQQAMADGYLVPYVAERFEIPEYHPERLKVSDLDRSKADFSDGDIEKALFEQHAVEGIARACAVEAKLGRKVVCFTPSVAISKAVAAELVSQGVAAASIDGSISSLKREKTLADHRGGRIKVLCNCAVLTEGYDDPSIDSVVIARPTQSKSLYVQMVGRGLRISPSTGKKDCRVIDLVGADEAHGLVTAEVLDDYGEDIDHSAETLADLEQEREAYIADPDAAKKRLESFLRKLAGERIASASSSTNWLTFVRGRCYGIPLNDGIVSIDKTDSGWLPVLSLKGKKEPVDLIDVAFAHRSDAMRYVEGALGPKIRSSFASSRDHEWRKNPASPGALRALERWKLAPSSGLDAGTASDILNIRIGSIGYQKREKAREKLAKIQF